MAYYTHSSGVPAANARGVSSNIRSEFDLIQTGFTSAYNDIQVLAAAIGAGTSSVESPIASATTTTIGSAGGNIVSITGTNTISSFGTTYNGAKYVRFTGSLTLLASASLVTPSGANIVTQAGDSCIVVPIGSPASGWRIASYERMSLPNLTDDAVRKATATLQTLVGSLAAVTFSASTSLVMGAASNAGLTVQTYTGGSKAAIYSNAVTPGASNYSLLTDSVSTTLNASTSVLLAIGGTTAATITNTGLNSTAIGATTPSTGAFTTLSATGNIVQNAGTVQTALSYAGALGVIGTLTNHAWQAVVNSTEVGRFSSTGLAVTGAVSATGNISTTGAIASGGIVSSTGFQSTSNGTNSSGSGVEILGGASGIVQGYNRTGGAYINMVVDGLSVALKSSGTTRAFVDSTGLAVTGQISASGRADFTLASTGRVGTFAGSGDRLRVFVNAASSGATIDVTDSGETTTARPLNIGGSNGTINLGGTTAVVSSTGVAVTGAVSTTGQITTSNVAGNTIFEASTATTNAKPIRIANTGGNAYFGVESSAGGSFLTGAAAYSFVINNVANTPIHFATNNTLQATLDTSGNFAIGAVPTGTYKFEVTGNSNFTGTVGATGNISTTAAIGAGGAPFSGVKLYSTGNTAAATTTYGVRDDQVIQSTSSTHRSVFAFPSTQATAFTLGAYEAFHANLGTIGSGSTITSAIGFLAASSLGGAGTAYGFQGAIAAGTNKYNLYMSGTADNYIAGNLGLGITPWAWGGSIRAMDLGIGSALINVGSATDTRLVSNAFFDTGWKYKNTAAASNYQQSSGAHAWFTAPSGAAGTAITFTQAMTLDASGNLLVGTTSALGRGTFETSSTTQAVISLNSSSASYTGANIFSNSSTTAGTTWKHFYGVSSSNTVADINIFGNGNIQNINNSYAAISDLKLKENVTDATPKLSDLMRVRIVNYNLKAPFEQHRQIGVIAQELEQIFPGMVDESPDYATVTKTREIPAVLDDEGNEVTPAKTEEYTEQEATGTSTKSVKYSVFVPMLIKAMQEQQALIESLTARIAALEAA